MMLFDKPENVQQDLWEGLWPTFGGGLSPLWLNFVLLPKLVRELV